MDALNEAIDSGVIKKVMDNKVLSFECIVCKVRINGPEPCIGHLQGKNHHKKFSTFGVSYGVDSSENNDDLTELIKDEVLKPLSKEGTVYYLCTVCDKTMSGTVPTKAHIVSAKHIKKYKQLNASLLASSSKPVEYHTMIDSKDSSVLNKHSSDHSMNNSSDDRVSNEDLSVRLKESLSQGTLHLSSYYSKQVFTCLACTVALEGEQEASSHLLSSSHVQKMKISAPHLCSGLSSSTHPISPPSDCNADMIKLLKCGLIEQKSSSFRCLLCGVHSNSQVSLRCHLNSSSHLKAYNLYSDGSSKKIKTDILSSSTHTAPNVNGINGEDLATADSLLIVLPSSLPVPKLDQILSQMKNG